jgi:hypothetical protein
MCVAVLGLLGGVVSGVGAAMGMNAEAAGLDAQSKFKKRQAAMETEAGAAKARQIQGEVDRTAGAQRAGFAANGIALSGSAEDVILDSAEEGALDVATVRWNSKLASDNLRYSAKIDKMNAKSTRKAAPLAFIAPVLSSAASFAGEYASQGA